MRVSRPPVVVVPGITASNLRDEYPIGPEAVWGILRKSWDRIKLHPDDVRYEQVEPARVRADTVFGFPYANFIEDLRHDLAVSADRPVPVYPFAYDWRQPLDVVEKELEAFVREVIARTALLRHYHAEGFTARNGKVDLVGHSMGGLVIAGYVERSKAKRVRKVATLGAPFKGSFEAALKMITGLGELGDSASREREAARLTPALYHLLPRFKGAVTSDPGLGVDLFAAKTWQPSVIQTIADQIRLYGLDGENKNSLELTAAATALFQQLLDDASAHRRRVGTLNLNKVGMSKDDWLAVVGVGEETRVHLHIEKHTADGTPWFDLGSTERKNGYPDTTVDENGFTTARSVDSGDGTVPYEAAVPPFLGVENVVCLCDDDFGYWELRDRFLERGVAGKGVSLHSLLPAMNVVEKLVVQHFRGEAGARGPAHSGVWGRHAPNLPADRAWRPPLLGLRDKAK